MNESKSVKRRNKFRTPLRVLGVVAFITLIYTQRDLFSETYNTITNVNLVYLFIIPLIQVVNYSAISMYYRYAVEPKMELSFVESWSLVSALSFVNVVLPSGGLSGISFLLIRLSDRLNSAIIAVVQLGRYLASMLSYVAVFLVAAFLSWLGFGSGEGVIDAISGINISSMNLFMLVIFMVLVFATIAILSSKKRTALLVARVVNFLNKVISFFTKRSSDYFKKPKIDRSIKEMHESFNYFFAYKKSAAKSYAAMIVSTSCELAIVATSLLAIGVELSPLEVLVAMSVANLVGVISVIPGDVGVHEASAVATLALFGVDEASALSSVLIYRFYVKALFLPVGYWFYNRGLVKG